MRIFYIYTYTRFRRSVLWRALSIYIYIYMKVWLNNEFRVDFIAPERLYISRTLPGAALFNIA